MQYEVNTPTEYMDTIENDWRKEKIVELRAMIKAKVPGVNEGINYKMLSYRQGEEIIFHLNAQKKYVCLYVGNITKIDPNGVLLNGLNLGKGCIRFKKSDSIHRTRVDEFIEEVAKIWKQGGDISC